MNTPSFLTTFDKTEKEDGLWPPPTFMTCILFLTRSKGCTKHVAAMLKKKLRKFREIELFLFLHIKHFVVNEKHLEKRKCLSNKNHVFYQLFSKLSWKQKTSFKWFKSKCMKILRIYLVVCTYAWLKKNWFYSFFLLSRFQI